MLTKLNTGYYTFFLQHPTVSLAICLPKWNTFWVILLHQAIFMHSCGLNKLLKLFQFSQKWGFMFLEVNCLCRLTSQLGFRTELMICNSTGKVRFDFIYAFKTWYVYICRLLERYDSLSHIDSSSLTSIIYIQYPRNQESMRESLFPPAVKGFIHFQKTKSWQFTHPHIIQVFLS